MKTCRLLFFASALALLTAGCAIVACLVSWIGSRAVHEAEVAALRIIAAKAADSAGETR